MRCLGATNPDTSPRWRHRDHRSRTVRGALRARAAGIAARHSARRGFDSLADEPLSGAFLVASSGGATATSDSLGCFVLISETRVDHVMASHEALDHMGLGTIGATRPANASTWKGVVISTPSRLSIWPEVCDSCSPDRQRSGNITGTARLADQRTRVAGEKVIVQWTPVLPSRDALHVLESVTDLLGNFAVCGVEDFA